MDKINHTPLSIGARAQAIFEKRRAASLRAEGVKTSSAQNKTSRPADAIVRDTSGPKRAKSADGPSLLTGLFHPATKLYASHVKAEVHGLDAHRKAGMLNLRAEGLRPTPLKIPSTDGVVLDSLLICRPGIQGKQIPLLVMTPGNAQSAESLMTIAGQHALEYDCNVLLYNGRGTGLSTGPAEKTMQDAVADCTAVIRAACKKSSSVGVWGFSLGGGITASALSALQSEPEVHGKIKLYLNVNSFSSLSRAAGSVVSNIPSLQKFFKDGLNRPVRTLARIVMSLSRFDNLNSAKLVSESSLAEKTVVFSSTDDEMISGKAQLGSALERRSIDLKDKGITLAKGTGSHNDIDFLDHADYVEALSHWSASAKARTQPKT